MKEFWLVGFVALLLGFLAGAWTSAISLESVWQSRLIAADVAHYECDPQTGKTRFVIEAKEKP